jgi:hypothetical protein
MGESRTTTSRSLAAEQQEILHLVFSFDGDGSTGRTVTTL